MKTLARAENPATPGQISGQPAWMLRYGRQFATIGATVLLGGTVLAFFGLIGLGRWQLDEYFDFYGMRSGLPWVLNRLRWSPRPISEPFFLLYGWLVNTLHRPLIIPFLAIFWAVFLFAGLFTFRQLPHLCGWGRARDHLLIALTLMALFLAGGHFGRNLLLAGRRGCLHSHVSGHSGALPAGAGGETRNAAWACYRGHLPHHRCGQQRGGCDVCSVLHRDTRSP